jgi:hypothetical protein
VSAGFRESTPEYRCLYSIDGMADVCVVLNSSSLHAVLREDRQGKRKSSLQAWDYERQPMQLTANSTVRQFVS